MPTSVTIVGLFEAWISPDQDHGTQHPSELRERVNHRTRKSSSSHHSSLHHQAGQIRSDWIKPPPPPPRRRTIARTRHARAEPELSTPDLVAPTPCLPCRPTSTSPHPPPTTTRTGTCRSRQAKAPPARVRSRGKPGTAPRPGAASTRPAQNLMPDPAAQIRPSPCRRAATTQRRPSHREGRLPVSRLTPDRHTAAHNRIHQPPRDPPTSTGRIERKGNAPPPPS